MLYNHLAPQDTENISLEAAGRIVNSKAAIKIYWQLLTIDNPIRTMLRGQPSPTILYTDSLSQLADMARLYAVLC